MTTRPCADCGKPTTRGRTSGNGSGNTLCLVCETARLFAGWHYPAARRQTRTKNDRAWSNARQRARRAREKNG